MMYMYVYVHNRRGLITLGPLRQQGAGACTLYIILCTCCVDGTCNRGAAGPPATYGLIKPYGPSYGPYGTVFALLDFIFLSMKARPHGVSVLKRHMKIHHHVGIGG